VVAGGAGRRAGLCVSDEVVYGVETYYEVDTGLLMLGLLHLK
jgi:hypothetical protein